MKPENGPRRIEMAEEEGKKNMNISFHYDNHFSRDLIICGGKASKQISFHRGRECESEQNM